jgi:hypothetical protein
LENILALPRAAIRYDRSKLLRWISGYSWFNSEFIRVGGFGWLEEEIALLHDLEFYVILIVKALNRADSFNELVQWMSSLRECLIRGPITCRSSNLSQDLGLILSKQKEQRSYIHEPSQPVPPTPNSRYSYVSTWNDLEWNDWCCYMEQLIEGVKRLYIPDSGRYFEDPDGFCHHSQNQRTEYLKRTKQFGRGYSYTRPFSH